MKQPTMPTYRVTDKRFTYTSAACTDIGKRVQAWRQEQERAQMEQAVEVIASLGVARINARQKP